MVDAVLEDGPFPVLPETGIVPVVVWTTPTTSSKICGILSRLHFSVKEKHQFYRHMEIPEQNPAKPDQMTSE